MNEVSKDTFQGFDTDSKLNTLYDYIHDIHVWQTNSCSRCKEQTAICDKRISKVENQLKKDRLKEQGISGFTGILGGIIAVIGKALLFKM